MRCLMIHNSNPSQGNERYRLVVDGTSMEFFPMPSNARIEVWPYTFYILFESYTNSWGIMATLSRTSNMKETSFNKSSHLIETL